MACMGKRADILERFGQRVRELRKEQGYSQESFAAACELDRTYIGGIERGERNVALRNIESIAQTLGITLAELMEGLSVTSVSASSISRIPAVSFQFIDESRFTFRREPAPV